MITRAGDAVAGFKTAVDLPIRQDDQPSGDRVDYQAYALIFGHLAARLGGNLAEAGAFLRHGSGKPNADAWPGPIVRYLRGEIDERALLAAAIDDDKRTDVETVLGLEGALKGRTDQALAHFRWVRDHGNPAFPEYTLALNELKRLEPRWFTGLWPGGF